MPFDPNKPFEVVQDREPSGFDPSKPFDVVQAEVEPRFFEQGGTFQAGVSGLAKGITFGFSDEIGAGLRSAFGDETYEEALRSQRAHQEAARKAQPKTFLGAEVLGSFAAPIPGAGLARGATLGAKVLKGAKVGAGIGAVEAAGRTEDLLSMEGLKDVAVGAGLGGVVGGVIPAIGGVISAIPARIKKAAPTPTELRGGLISKTPTQRKAEILNPKLAETSEQAIKTGERHGVFNTMSKTKLVPNVQVKLKEVGKGIESLAKTSTKDINRLETGLVKKGLLDKIDEGFASGLLDESGSKRMRKVVEVELAKLDSLMRTEPNSLMGVRKLKINLRKRLKSKDYTGEGPKAGSSADAVKSVADELTKLERKFAPSEDYKKLLDDWGSLKELESGLVAGVVKDAGKALLNIGDLLKGEIGAAAAGPLGAAALTGSKFLNTPAIKLMIANALEKGGAHTSALALKLKVKPNVLTKALSNLKKNPSYIAAGFAVGDQ